MSRPYHSRRACLQENAPKCTLAATVRLRYIPGMENDPPVRKTVALPASMWQEIADFRFSERIGTEAEALRRLIQAGLRAEQKRLRK